MKFLVLDKPVPGVTMEQIAPHLKEEARAAWAKYKAGVFRELYYRGDRPGVALILEAESLEVAKKHLADLPLSRAGVGDFEVIPLGPFVPFEALFSGDASAR